jgi:hypothetical protein
MGEKRTNESRLTRVRSGRYLAFGTTGFAAAVTLLMVLSPASGAIVHPTIVLSPAYKNTVNSPNAYWSVSGCAKAKAATPHWNAATGGVTGVAMASAKTCGKNVGGVGGSSSGSASDGLSIAIPFKVSTNGNHAIATSISLTLASANTSTWAPCPPTTGSYPPALNAYFYGYCEVGSSLSMYTSINVVDLTNTSWYGNYSYADSYNYGYWENYTYCYNYGTPTCSNFTGGAGYASAYGYNAPAFATNFLWNGASSWTMWNNGTGMLKTHHYALILSESVSASAYAYYYNIAGSWLASASASINMGTLGNGATVNSVTIT